MSREKFEQRVFARGDRHFRVRATHATCGKIDANSADDERRRGVSSGAADERAQAGQQFVEVERLWQIIIRTSIEAGTFSEFKIDFLRRYYG